MVTTYKLFTATTCPACPAVKAHLLSRVVLKGEVIELNPTRPEGFALARTFGIASVPQVIFFDAAGKECARARTAAEIDDVMAKNELLQAA